MNAKLEWRPARLLLPATIVLAIALVAAVPAYAVEECCTIVGVDPAKNQIVVRETATGRTKILTITNKQLLQQLQPGAAYGPDAIGGIPEAPSVFEPNWVEECCNFKATVKEGEPQHTLRATVKAAEPQHTFTQQVGTSALAASSAMSVDLGPGVTITLQSVKRLGSRVVRLDFSVRNDTGDRVYLQNNGLFDAVHHSLRDVSMIDYDAGLRYGALIDSEGTCACSRGSGVGNIDRGQEASYWVQIKAPPGNVNVVSIDFAGKASIDNVPIAP